MKPNIYKKKNPKLLLLRAWRKCVTHKKYMCIYSPALVLFLLCVVFTEPALASSHLGKMRPEAPALSPGVCLCVFIYLLCLTSFLLHFILCV